ncbi:MAG TPA: L,D-transpeptidase [Polyangiales bacterium]
MARPLRHVCVLVFMFALACGGARGEAEHMGPQTASAALATRYEAPKLVERKQTEPVRVPAATSERVRPALPPTSTGALAPTTTKITTVTDPRVSPVDRSATEYPLYGVAFHVLAQVFSEPSDTAVVTGYFRRGGQLRAKRGLHGKGCNTLWHELSGGGFVCAGRGFLLGTEPQTFDDSPTAATLHEDLPYSYGKTLQADALQYYRMPSRSEESASHAQLAATAKLHGSAKQDASPAAAKRGDDAAKTLEATDADALPGNVRMQMRPGFYVSVDKQDESDGRVFARTVRGAYVRADALGPVSVSPLHGTTMLTDQALPLGLVYRAGTPHMRRDAMTGALQADGKLSLMQPFALTDEVVTQGNRRYRVARDGSVLPEDALRIVEHVDRPPLVPPRTRWISIQLSTQTLVAYEGKIPVFATLVSTGKPEHETPTGIFRIQSKHVSTTMDGETGTDEAYSIEDVPWTMYFSGSIALHAAFWHERFGRVRSHGCVNLAPADARWLFEWTTPNLPAGFHGVNATRDSQGTFVVIDP